MTTLLDARATLAERRRLLTAGGWLSLLAATCLIDLGLRDAAAAHLATAAQLAHETGQTELDAWCMETRAWQALTDGDYLQAATISQGAQRVAPSGGSAAIQATAQEGRAWARIGAVRETYAAMRRVETLVSPLPMPENPEHHYRYDPAKSEAYVATTLAWIGDPAAEGFARQVLARLESPPDGPPRPRRAASARLDLAPPSRGPGASCRRPAGARLNRARAWTDEDKTSTQPRRSSGAARSGISGVSSSGNG